ncbi:MAG: hypothetical protein L6R43_07730, partial [Planctomycetes bacterium]|nr:hypothetical protein [Planctomycetota bacterium]
GVAAGAAAASAAFAGAWRGVLAAVEGIQGAARGLQRLEGRDAGWNLLAFGGALAAAAAWLLGGVAP